METKMTNSLSWALEFSHLARELENLAQKVSHELIHNQMKTIAENLHGASTAFKNRGDPIFIANQLMKMFDTVSQGGVASMARSVLSQDDFEEFQDIMQTVNVNGTYIKQDLKTGDRIMLLSSNDIETRKWAALTLGFSSDKQSAIQPLIKALSDSNSSVRLYSAISLGRIQDTAALESLGSLLIHDEHEGVRSTAALALGQLNDLKAIPFLEQGVNDENKDVSDSSQKSLSKLQAAT
jgi:hypothetical protein